MYKNLSAEGLGFSGRQSELIELAMTHKFKGFDLDIGPIAKQVKNHGTEHARRYIDSAGIKIGNFPLPVRWQDDVSYKDDLGQLGEIAEAAASVGATRCFTTVMPACDSRPYHENFEFHRQRLTEIGDILALHGVHLGLDFLATAEFRQGREFQFIWQVESLVLLIKMIGLSNLGAVVDLWNWHVGGGTLEQIKELSSQGVVQVRLADIPADADLETITHQQRLLPSSDGVVDTVGALRLLRELDYDGPITPFPNPSLFSGMTRDKIVQQASKAIDEQWKSASALAEQTLAT